MRQLNDAREVVTWHSAPTSVARSGDTAVSDAPRPFTDGSTVVWPSKTNITAPLPGLSKAMT